MIEQASQEEKRSGTEGVRTPWHARSSEAVLAELKVSRTGLTEQEAEARLAVSGSNLLPEAERASGLRRFFMQFHNMLIYVLLVSAGITAFLGHLTDTAVILAVVVANAVIGMYQEGKAEKAMEAIRGMLAPMAAVLRDGRRQTLPAERLTAGDIVLLEAGDRVPADLRLTQVHALGIQESVLTGESVAVEKRTEAVEAESALGDRLCMAFSGTLVTSGQGRGVVVETGAGTEIGRISSLLGKVEALSTPLMRQMDAFSRKFSVYILVAALFLLVFGYWVWNYDFAELFMAVVGLSVAAIPEGLPAVLTITLSIGVQKMARRQAIVRRLPAIETIGSVSVICTDKTGTLTRNEMMVATVAVGSSQFEVSGSGYDPRGEIRAQGESCEREQAIVRELALGLSLCNDATLREQEGSWRVEGDPMEGALLAFAHKSWGKDSVEWKNWTRTDVIPFDAEYRFMATLHHNHQRRALAFVKGAPERILELCSGQRGPDGTVLPLAREAWIERIEAIAGEGRRVLALAMRPMPEKEVVLDFEDIEAGLVLIGLVGLIDPPRPEVFEAVKSCREAGIRIKMITGDHAKTAAAIGSWIGLESKRVLTGVELDRLDDRALASAVLEVDIYARTSPEHKLRLVTALQSHGLTVAMTGDGINDSPALKRADVGIAMGLKGSEAAKEASQLVLADDHFATIVAAVKEGRTVYDNLKKVIGWSLPTSIGEAMTLVFALLFGMTLPVTAVQILWVNLITAVTLGLALAFEPTEQGTMSRPPRRRDEPLLSGTLAWHIVYVSLLFLMGVFGMFAYRLQSGGSIESARSVAVNTLVVMEIFHLFFIRNIYGKGSSWRAFAGTPVVWLTVGVAIACQAAITYHPWLQAVFEMEALSAAQVLGIFAVGVALFAAVELEKRLRLRWTRG